MTEIKSALELALEKTQDIESDKGTLLANERRTDGKRLASKYLKPGDEKTDIAGAFKQFKNDEGNFVREGFFETILANLNLPSNAEYKERLKYLESGIHLVTKEKRQVSYLFQQVDQFFEQYLQTKEQVNEQLKTQYEPQLKEKERLLAQQMGSQITLTPESDPEFMNLLAKNYARLDEQYNQALGQVKEELKRVASFKK
jgi:hypothetical protein